MEIADVLCVAVLVAIITYICLTTLGIRIWSALVLSILLGFAFMITLYPISELMKRELDNGVLAYLAACIFVFLFVMIYVVVKCCSDVRRDC